VVGATEFVNESLDADGHWQLTCYSISDDYRSVMQSVTLDGDGVWPKYLQPVDGEDCVCGISSELVTIWYISASLFFHTLLYGIWIRGCLTLLV